MNKIHLILALVAVGAMALVLSINPVKALIQKDAQAQSANGIPEDVMKIINHSCIACHGNGGNPMAMSHVNFSKWDTYPLNKQTKKANDVCDAVTRGIMPPASVRQSSPDKVPNAAQIATICKWAATVK